MVLISPRSVGVSPVTLKTLMRHARIETTLKHYAEPALLDVAGAVEMLPAVSSAPAASLATGTDSVALPVALTSGRTRQNVALSGNPATARRQSKKPMVPARNTGITGFSVMGDIGLGDSRKQASLRRGTLFRTLEPELTQT